MPKKRVPKTFPINHDDYHARYVGRLADGRQFFLTTPFEPAIGNSPGGEFVALFLFAADGSLLEAKIDQLGPRKDLDEARRDAVIQSHIDELAAAGSKFQRIKIAPFQTEQHGTTFGLIPRQPEDEEDELAIELHPGNAMAFFPPWEGDYDT